MANANQAAPPGDEFAVMFAAAGLPGLAAPEGPRRGRTGHRYLRFSNARIIDGTGAPPWGPADLIVADGRIIALAKAGKAKLPPEAQADEVVEIDCAGKFLTPGLIDCHAHIGAPFHARNGPQPSADYVYKLWLGHGVTTVRETGCFNGLSWTVVQKAEGEAGRLDAPRILPYAPFPATTDYVKSIHTPDQARDWVDAVKAAGADGIKFFASPPALMKAALERCAELDLRSCCHHAQLAVGRMNPLQTASWGLTSTEHSYGIPETLLEAQTLQSFPPDYDYGDEYLRFAAAGQTFMQAAAPGSPKWQAVLARFLESGHSFVPTFNVYDANRDLMRTRRADWHERFTDPTLWSYFQPQRGGHGSYWYRWSTTNEIEWRETFRRWMRFVNDYKNLGGRIACGSDSGFMYQTYGFGLIRELELLQEAGFTPLEVLRSATACGAELLGIDHDTGTLEIGKRADILVHRANPLNDFKLLYGTGTMRLDDATATVNWERSLETVVAGGTLYDAAELLADVEAMVATAKAAP